MAADENDKITDELFNETGIEAVRDACETIQQALATGEIPEAEAEELSDRLAALSIYQHDLVQDQAREADRRMQLSLYSAMLNDDRLLSQERAIEQQAIEDRAEAARVNGSQAPLVPDLVRAQISDRVYEDEHLSQIDNEIDNENVLMPADFRPGRFLEAAKAESSQAIDISYTSNPKLKRYIAALREQELFAALPRNECGICCMEFLPEETVKLDCDHTWCKSCIIRVFTDATISEESWPPRCCSEVKISNSLAGPLLETQVKGRYAAKSIEWNTKKRTYCYMETCSTFIPPADIGETVALCPRCGLKTCASCKRKLHDGDCEEVINDKLLEETAKSEAWQKCPSCGHLVSISHGCNHMT